MVRSFLPQVFGTSVQVQILDALCGLITQEAQSDTLKWINLSNLASLTHVAKSSVKRIVDQLITQEWVEEKQINTHAQNPPREIRLNVTHPVIKELLFFYQKIRGYL